MLTFSQNCEELWSENGVTTLAKQNEERLFLVLKIWIISSYSRAGYCSVKLKKL